MATRVIDDSKLDAIAVAIQTKDNGGQMTVDEMPGRIEAIPGELTVDEDSESPQLVFGIDSGGFYISNNVNDKTDVKFGVDANGHVYVANGGSTNV
jgi:hypothetical protein